MNVASRCTLGVLLVACSARPHAPEGHVRPPLPAPASHTTTTPAPLDPVCRAERVRALWRVEATASTEMARWFVPDLLASSGPSSLDRVATAVLAGGAPPPAPGLADVCWDRGRPGLEFARATSKSDRVQIFDVQRLETTGMTAPLLAVLSSRDALHALLADTTAHFELSLLDERFQVVARTGFATVRPAERTLDGVGAFLRLEHGLLHAHVTFGCPAAKYGERFDVPIAVGSAPCARADEQPFPPESYRRVPALAACRRGAVVAASRRSLPSYEATQGQYGAWLAMPYIADDVAELDADWHRIAMLLAPADPERASEVVENLADEAGVGSLQHTTARWSYVKGRELRLHQLLPVKTSAGLEAYLALYTRASPQDLLARGSAAFRVALLSPAYELRAEVALEPRPPADAYRALQTGLTLVDGQPVVRLRYTRRVPEPGPVPPLGAGDWEVSIQLQLKLEAACLAAAPV